MSIATVKGHALHAIQVFSFVPAARVTGMGAAEVPLVGLNASAAVASACKYAWSPPAAGWPGPRRIPPPRLSQKMPSCLLGTPRRSQGEAAD